MRRSCTGWLVGHPSWMESGITDSCCAHCEIHVRPIFMALLIVSKESALTGAGNSKFTSSLFRELAARFCLCAFVLGVTRHISLTQLAQKCCACTISSNGGLGWGLGNLFPWNMSFGSRTCLLKSSTTHISNNLNMNSSDYIYIKTVATFMSHGSGNILYGKLQMSKPLCYCCIYLFIQNCVWEFAISIVTMQQLALKPS